ncbi:MAG: putative bifunctional diguanylate cyclase/phosphodiesterase, partial [Actinomycetes bacterium]
LLYASHLSAVADRLQADATSDPLTGLRNRRAWLTALEDALAEVEIGRVAVALVDLDGFKEVNDSFGHAAGDVALGDVAQRMRDVADDGMLAARLGGDEFALLVVGTDAEQRAVVTADRLCRGQQSRIGAISVSVGASAGIAVSRERDDASSILRRADLAMYDAKRARRSQATVFSDDMAHRAERRHLLAQALPGAAERGELEVVYQPLFRLDDGSIAGAEALVRWRHPLHGDVSPAEFISLAEEVDVIAELGAAVLAAAARDVAGWDGRLPRLFVNVSPKQLSGAFAASAVATLEQHGVAPAAVTLEITESAVPDLHADRCIEQLRAAGFDIAMDDFGSGFSSLSQLAAMPVDTLKFDREFIRGIHTPNGRRIVDTIIALAGELGLTTVAEGIETAAEADVVRRAGCDLAQGYHFARPMSAGELTALLAGPTVAASVPAHVSLPVPRRVTGRAADDLSA